ncbi:MAG: hypothetical protein JWM33_3943 [Caulobacteraceae bacterium]|nr:hypothetical protein [Caulobacteraceae bacterium]
METEQLMLPAVARPTGSIAVVGNSRRARWTLIGAA